MTQLFYLIALVAITILYGCAIIAINLTDKPEPHDISSDLYKILIVYSVISAFIYVCLSVIIDV